MVLREVLRSCWISAVLFLSFSAFYEQQAERARIPFYHVITISLPPLPLGPSAFYLLRQLWQRRIGLGFEHSGGSGPLWFSMILEFSRLRYTHFLFPSVR
jgi:hypothetical protein